jgi:hypothetical protein
MIYTHVLNRAGDRGIKSPADSLRAPCPNSQPAGTLGADFRSLTAELFRAGWGLKLVRGWEMCLPGESGTKVLGPRAAQRLV